MTKQMMMKAALALAVIGGTVATAQAPVHMVDPHRHPNLAAAQQLTQQAIQRIQTAQAANDFDMNDHAMKAKMHLQEAMSELGQAALAANANGHH